MTCSFFENLWQACLLRQLGPLHLNKSQLFSYTQHPLQLTLSQFVFYSGHLPYNESNPTELITLKKITKCKVFKLFALLQLGLLLTHPCLILAVVKCGLGGASTPFFRDNQKQGHTAPGLSPPLPSPLFCGQLTSFPDHSLCIARSVAPGKGLLSSFRLIWKTWHNSSHFCLGLHLELLAMA